MLKILQTYGQYLPSGLTVCHGKSPCLIGRPSISMGHLYHGELLVITRPGITDMQLNLTSSSRLIVPIDVNHDETITLWWCQPFSQPPMTGNGKFIAPVYLWWWLGDGANGIALLPCFTHIISKNLHRSYLEEREWQRQLASSLDSTDESKGATSEGPSLSIHTLRVKNRQPVSHRSGRRSKTLMPWCLVNINT